MSLHFAPNLVHKGLAVDRLVARDASPEVAVQEIAVFVATESPWSADEGVRAEQGVVHLDSSRASCEGPDRGLT
jgi:hypothetical protein